jgi:excisionase family DNA binding protein
VRLARESSQRLRRLVKANRTLRFTPAGGRSGPVEIPAPAADLLLRLLNQLAQGHAVTIVPVRAELTTQQAAEILGVSRPFVVKEIEERRLPARKVGTRRRVMLGDLMTYKQRSDASRQRALADLAALDEELGLP